MLRTLLLVTLASAALALAPAASAAPSEVRAAPETAPANDAFANATPISGASGSITGTNVGATKEPNEQNHANNTGGASVWYTWTAPATSNVRFDTCTSPVLFVEMAVYTGNSVDALTEIAPGVNTCAPGATVDLAVTAGTIYHIAIDGFDLGATADQGAFTLTWTGPPANDAFANPRPISGASGSTFGSTIGASEEPGEPDHAGNIGGASVWFTWTAPSTGVTRFRTCRANSFDTLLAVYTGNAVEALTPVAANDGGGCPPQSIVDVATTAGTTYRIAVDGYGTGGGTASGTYALKWAPRPAHGPDLWVREGAEPWGGNGVYDVSGRTQLRRASIGRAGTARFSFRIENDDSITRMIHLLGTATSPTFRVTYLLTSGADVTDIVVEGTDLSLAAGASLRFDVVVKPRASRVAVGDNITVKFRATDVAAVPMPPDTAIARVTLR